MYSSLSDLQHLPQVASRAVKPRGVWQALQSLWCRHLETAVTPKTGAMPAHTVCACCGWREPLTASVPVGTRTWDSSRDDARFEREKKRRAALDDQKRLALALHSTPTPRFQKTRRSRRGNVVDMNRAVGQ